MFSCHTSIISALRRGSGVVLLGFGLGAAAPVFAGTVTNLNDSGLGSLRQAIADAASGDTIDFSVTGTITLTSGELVIDKDLTIQGPGADQLTISGNNASRVFFINPGAPGATSGPPATSLTVTFSNLTIADGKAKGGNGGTSKNDFGSGGGAAGMGGALFINNGDVTIEQVVLTSNQAIGGNGGNIIPCCTGVRRVVVAGWAGTAPMATMPLVAATVVAGATSAGLVVWARWGSAVLYLFAAVLVVMVQEAAAVVVVKLAAVALAAAVAVTRLVQPILGMVALVEGAVVVAPSSVLVAPLAVTAAMVAAAPPVWAAPSFCVQGHFHYKIVKFYRTPLLLG